MFSLEELAHVPLETLQLICDSVDLRLKRIVIQTGLACSCAVMDNAMGFGQVNVGGRCNQRLKVGKEPTSRSLFIAFRIPIVTAAAIASTFFALLSSSCL